MFSTSTYRLRVLFLFCFLSSWLFSLPLSCVVTLVTYTSLLCTECMIYDRCIRALGREFAFEFAGGCSRPPGSEVRVQEVTRRVPVTSRCPITPRRGELIAFWLPPQRCLLTFALWICGRSVMLDLSRLRDRLSQILSLPDLHTAILLTPAGQLVSVACDPFRPKDEIRVVVGLSGEVWHETREEGVGMVDSEVCQQSASPFSFVNDFVCRKLGRIVVLPVDDKLPDPLPEDYQPLMLLVLNSTTAVEWEELKAKVSS